VKRVIQILLLCFPLLLGAADDRYNDLGNKIQCACGCGQMLLKCNHVGCPSSEAMIRQLRTSVTNYKDDEDVLNWFRRNYGVTVVVSPATHGFELTIWVLPPILAAASLVLVFWIVRRWRARAALASSIAVAPDPYFDELRARARKETEL
jgi:cytochrome c-type biogenesis protein CcmH